MRLIAYYIKICRLCFKTRRPLDALAFAVFEFNMQINKFIGGLGYRMRARLIDKHLMRIVVFCLGITKGLAHILKCNKEGIHPRQKLARRIYDILLIAGLLSCCQAR